jgi:hypothetical protein
MIINVIKMNNINKNGIKIKITNRNYIFFIKAIKCRLQNTYEYFFQNFLER